MTEGPITPRRLPLPSVTTETNGNGDHRGEEVPDPPGPPRSLLQIAADCAMEAKAAALQASGWAGEAMGAAIASKRASDALTVDFAALRVDFAAMRAEFSEVAKAVGARRTVSGTLTIPPLEMRVERSDTGEHQALTTAELERVQQQYDDLATRLQASEQRALVAEAEERGARAENERLEAEKFRAEKAVEAARARSKELRDRVLFVLAFLTPTAAIGAWLLSHYH